MSNGFFQQVTDMRDIFARSIDTHHVGQRGLGIRVDHQGLVAREGKGGRQIRGNRGLAGSALGHPAIYKRRTLGSKSRFIDLILDKLEATNVGGAIDVPCAIAGFLASQLL
jgi:hypothetical protein